jgi:hypothetical protein
LHDRRERAGTGRPVQPRQQGLPALALVFDILDPDFGPGFSFEYGSHESLPQIAAGL